MRHKKNSVWIVAVLLAGASVLAYAGAQRGKLPADVKKIAAFARGTRNVKELKWAIRTLAVEGSEDSVTELKKLLTNEEVLMRLFRWSRVVRLELQLPTENDLFEVLRFLATNLDGPKASDLFSHLFQSKHFRLLEPHRGNETGILHSTAHRRSWGLSIAAGYIEDATPELIKALQKKALSRGSSSYEEPALGRIGTEEAVEALWEIGDKDPFYKRVGSVAGRVKEFRDRPLIFQFIVDCYMKHAESEPDFAGLVLPDLLAHHVGVPDPVQNDAEWEQPYQKLPSYEDVPMHEAKLFLKPIDRLLNQDHRPLTDEETWELKRIKSILAEKAREYERLQQNAPEKANERDQVKRFRSLVLSYLRFSPEKAEWILNDFILAERAQLEPGEPEQKLPDYEDVPDKHASAYVDFFDHLLYQNHRPLTEKERRKLQNIRDMLAKKAEKYKKQQREKKKEAKKEEAEK
ncbi:MAG: hypothetical protein ACLFWL_15260 [Candidatus Brocadiia bacterium]